MSKLNVIQERTGSKGELPATENFALQVTNYTTDQKGREAIAGIRLDTGEEAIVILRPYKGDRPLKAARAEVKDFVAKDGEISNLMKNLPTDEMRKQVLKGMKAKTEPGGTILVQRAYAESDTGVISAGWLQSAAKYPDHCKVVSNVMLRIDPVTYRENPKDKSQISYSYATAIHTAQSQSVKSLDEFKAAMQGALSGNAIMGGRPMALIRLSDGDASKAIEFPLPVKVNKENGEVTVLTPDNAVKTFMESEQGKAVASLVGDPDLRVEVIPGNKISIGSQAKASFDKAGGLELVNSAYRFKKEEQAETGFTPSYVVLHQVGDDGWVFSSAQPLSNRPSLFHPRDVATPHYDGRPTVVLENKEVPTHDDAPAESNAAAPTGDDFNIDDVVGQHMQNGAIPTAPRMKG